MVLVFYQQQPVTCQSVVRWQLTAKTLTAFGEMKFNHVWNYQASLLVIRFPFTEHVPVQTFKSPISGYGRLLKTDYRQHYHICFIWIPATVNHQWSANKRWCSFLCCLLLERSWHWIVHLIIIYFHSIQPHDHLVVKLFIYAACLVDMYNNQLKLKIQKAVNYYYYHY